MIKKEVVILYALLTVITLILLLIFGPTTLLQEPNVTPAAVLKDIPYWTIPFGTSSFIIIFPSETIIVLILGIQIIALGMFFFKKKKHVPSFWWGLSMILWGIGTLLAGTSYQGLGYELKCYGQPYCLFTSWFELSYLYVTALSICALAIAVAKSILPKDKQVYLIYYAFMSSIIYAVTLLTGTIFEIRFLISYELFTLFFMPLFLVLFIYSIIYYKVQKDDLNKTLIVSWILFLLVNVSYYAYYFLGLTQKLYETYQIWFSANDVLHVALILWMAYIWIKVKPQIHRLESQ